MDPNKLKDGFEQELQQIEELEEKTAPDGGETVLPLIGGGRH